VPSPSKRVRLGIGFGTDTGARITGNYKDLNFNHWGHELHVQTNVSQRLQNFIARYIMPGLSDLDSYTAFKGRMEHERFKSYENQTVYPEV
jgi:translocation and assembly module TamA